MINRLFALIMSLLFTFMGSPSGTVYTGSGEYETAVREEAAEEDDASEYDMAEDTSVLSGDSDDVSGDEAGEPAETGSESSGENAEEQDY